MTLAHNFSLSHSSWFENVKEDNLRTIFWTQNSWTLSSFRNVSSDVWEDVACLLETAPNRVPSGGQDNFGLVPGGHIEGGLQFDSIVGGHVLPPGNCPKSLP